MKPASALLRWIRHVLPGMMGDFSVSPTDGKARIYRGGVQVLEDQGNRGAANGYAPLGPSSLVAYGYLGTGGTGAGSKFLADDGTWKAGGGGGGTLDHAALTSNLAWSTSGHTFSGTYKLAGSSTTTAAAEITYTAFTATLLDDVDAPTARATLGLGNVENTALSTWAGSTNITTLGTIGTGTWQGSTLAIAYGGTGATTAGGARTALGLVIGTNVQAWDADLDGLAALGNGLPYRGAGVWGATALGDLAISGASVQVTQARGLRETSGPTTLAMGAVAAGELLIRSGTTIIGAAIGSVVQAYSAILTAITALGTAGLLGFNPYWAV